MSGVLWHLKFMNLSGRGRRGGLIFTTINLASFSLKLETLSRFSILHSFRFATAIIAQQAFRPFIPRHPVLTGSVTSIPTITNVIVCVKACGSSYIYLSRIRRKHYVHSVFAVFRVFLDVSAKQRTHPEWRKKFENQDFHPRRKRRSVFSRGGSVYRSASTRKGK